MDVHTTMLDALGDRGPGAAIAAGEIDDIADPGLRSVVTWARATLQPDSPILRRPPFADEDRPELIGVALAFQYINRMVNIFAATSPFPIGAPKITPVARRVASPLFRLLLLGRDVRPGASVDLLAPAPMPNDIGWAQADPNIAAAFGRATAAFDTVGQQALPAQVRQLVTEHLNAWRGERPGLSRSWLDDAVETLPAASRPLGRLTLLTAFASYQVDAQILDDARTSPAPAGDEALIAATSWASFAATRRIGSWLHTTTHTDDKTYAGQHSGPVVRARA